MIKNQNYHDLDKNYLIKQNRKLRMELKQANDLKQLHKKALVDFSKSQKQTSIIPILINIINLTNNESKLNQLNQHVMELEGKIMVLEKIVNQTDQNQKETYNLLADQFQKLRQENVKKEDQLHKFYEKIGQVDYISGLVTKYKEIISTTQQAMAFKKQQDLLLDALNIQQETIKKLTEQKIKLLKINIHMKQEVEKRKDQVRNMTMILMNQEDNMQLQEEIEAQEFNNNFLDELAKQDPNSKENNADIYQPNSQREISSTPKSAKGSNKNMSFSSNLSRINLSMSKAGINMSMMNTTTNNQNNTLNFVKMQRELIKQENQDKNSSDDSQLDCPQLTILFPDKVQKIVSNKQHAKIPYLNMKKIRQMMSKRQQKMRKQWQNQKNHINPTQKIIQIQTELQITRKQLANQSLKFRLMEDDIKKMSAQIQQIQKRNQLLVQSNIKLKSSHQMIYSEYQLCKSITNQVQKAIGLIITKENEKVARQKLYKLSILKSKNLQFNSHQAKISKEQQIAQLTKNIQTPIAVNALNEIFVSKNNIPSRKRVNSS